MHVAPADPAYGARAVGGAHHVAGLKIFHHGFAAWRGDARAGIETGDLGNDDLAIAGMYTAGVGAGRAPEIGAAAATTRREIPAGTTPAIAAAANGIGALSSPAAAKSAWAPISIGCAGN